MAVYIDLIPSRNNYRLTVPLDGVNYLFDNIHWNGKDTAWFMDIREEDETLILAGIKLVLGVRLGQSSTHKLFRDNIFSVSDSSGKQQEAGLDDMGGRVKLVVVNLAELTNS